jgi:hypothetical protein
MNKRLIQKRVLIFGYADDWRWAPCRGATAPACAFVGKRSVPLAQFTPTIHAMAWPDTDVRARSSRLGGLVGWAATG